MAVYRPTYTDKKTGEVKGSKVWWYDFTFAGKRIQMSSKSTRKTIAVEAEKKHRRELEQGFNSIGDSRAARIRTVEEIGQAFLEDYSLRHPQSAMFAVYAVRHLTRLLGKSMAFDVNEEAVKGYQTIRLKEGAAAKTINEEVGFLLRMLDVQGDVIRARLKKQNALKLKTRRTVAKAFTAEQKAALLGAARARRSPAIYPALMLALHLGIRDSELRNLQWERIDLEKAVITVGRSKTEAGEGRTIPLNQDALQALKDHARWYLSKFGETRPEWYVFPFGKPQPTDPTKPVGSLKTVWATIKANTGVTGRWHDNRHTFITDLAESGKASDENDTGLGGARVQADAETLLTHSDEGEEGSG